MRIVADLGRLPPWLTIAAFAVITVSAVSCSSDTARFDNPFHSRNTPEVTGSVQQRTKTVQSRPLPPPPTHVAAPVTRPADVSIAGGSRGIATYQPPVASNDVTGTVPKGPVTQPAAAPQPAVARTHWTWVGGTAVEVKPGENAHVLAQRYNVPVAAIVQANNLPDAASIKPGQRLIIPRSEMPAVTGSVTPPRAPAASPVAAVAPPHGQQLVHVVAPGETLSKISRQYKISVVALAKANKIPPHTMVKMGDRIVIPGMSAPKTAAVAGPGVPVSTKTAAKTAAKPVAGTKTAANIPVPLPPPAVAHMVTPVAEETKPKSAVATATAMPAFRWPVHGRVIATFGPKTSGQQNDGINVAVPEGTPIKAADDGVVAYAGNELKTYGNLVLIRHSNGYVTAYAHASEILVKRDEPIKRGQIIAKSGQTGNVSAPQLHFEIRKGSSPIDPMPFLNKGNI
jgi:murein DD-endopeptidase MepM/ murein hydrolase activator NlpD